jgi:uncharacterized Zn finger protein (UPF0148 family)
VGDMIDVRCPECGKLLGLFRIEPDGTLRCPRCGTVADVHGGEVRVVSKSARAERMQTAAPVAAKSGR